MQFLMIFISMFVGLAEVAAAAAGICYDVPKFTMGNMAASLSIIVQAVDDSDLTASTGPVIESLEAVASRTVYSSLRDVSLELGHVFSSLRDTVNDDETAYLLDHTLSELVTLKQLSSTLLSSVPGELQSSTPNDLMSCFSWLLLGAKLTDSLPESLRKPPQNQSLIV
jgi:hypothetical protein